MEAAAQGFVVGETERPSRIPPIVLFTRCHSSSEADLTLHLFIPALRGGHHDASEASHIPRNTQSMKLLYSLGNSPLLAD